jgi:hypothetical protein
MSTTIEIPFPPRPNAPAGSRVEPPWVPVEASWEYRQLTRDLQTEGLPSEAELNALGSDHWELTGVLREGDRVHFYFKRERVR